MSPKDTDDPRTLAATRTKNQAIEHLNDQIARLLGRARRVSVERARALDPGLSGTSYRLLVFLCDSGPHRAQQLVELFDLDKGAVSRYVQQLVDLGLVDRHPDATDKRATLVECTPLARRRVEEMRSRRFDEIGTLLGDWSSEKVEALAQQLAEYNRAFES